MRRRRSGAPAGEAALFSSLLAAVLAAQPAAPSSSTFRHAGGVASGQSGTSSSSGVMPNMRWVKASAMLSCATCMSSSFDAPALRRSAILSWSKSYRSFKSMLSASSESESHMAKVSTGWLPLPEVSAVVPSSSSSPSGEARVQSSAHPASFKHSCKNAASSSAQSSPATAMRSAAARTRGNEGAPVTASGQRAAAMLSLMVADLASDTLPASSSKACFSRVTLLASSPTPVRLPRLGLMSSGPHPKADGVFRLRFDAGLMSPPPHSGADDKRLGNDSVFARPDMADHRMPC